MDTTVRPQVTRLIFNWRVLLEIRWIWVQSHFINRNNIERRARSGDVAPRALLDRPISCRRASGERASDFLTHLYLMMTVLCADRVGGGGAGVGVDDVLLSPDMRRWFFGLGGRRSRLRACMTWRRRRRRLLAESVCSQYLLTCAKCWRRSGQQNRQVVSQRVYIGR